MLKSTMWRRGHGRRNVWKGCAGVARADPRITKNHYAYLSPEYDEEIEGVLDKSGYIFA